MNHGVMPCFTTNFLFCNPITSSCINCSSDATEMISTRIKQEKALSHMDLQVDHHDFKDRSYEESVIHESELLERSESFLRKNSILGNLLNFFEQVC